MGRKADARGGNCDVVFENEIARKYLRNTSSAEKVQRYQRELEVFRRICEDPVPHVVEVMGVHIDENKVSESFVTMKRYDGCLYDILYLTKGRPKFALGLLLPVIKALKILSERTPGIIHRDIKPDNILFLKNGEEYSLFLSDFGACFLKDDDRRITPADIAVGPRMFISPEYEKGRVEDITEKGDIFSIGKVIWCMINGEQFDLLPANYWFVSEYDLTNRFPNCNDMIIVNTIIASCLSIDPSNRCDYASLILQIETFLNTETISPSDVEKYKVKQYMEKRRIELIEIKEKNRLLVNGFSIQYVEALRRLKETYSGFDLLEKLYTEYLSKSKDGKEYSSVSVTNNAAHYLYSGTLDRFYIAIDYVPAKGNERYCRIKIRCIIDGGRMKDEMLVYYDETGKIVCNYGERHEVLSVNALMNCMNGIIMRYIG